MLMADDIRRSDTEPRTMSTTVTGSPQTRPQKSHLQVRNPRGKSLLSLSYVGLVDPLVQLTSDIVQFVF